MGDALSIPALLFLMLFMGGCVLAFARHPVYGLLTYLAVFYSHPPSRWWGASLPGVRWSLVAAAVTVLALLVRKSSPPKEAAGAARSLQLGLLTLFAWISLQYAWALDKPMQADLISIYAKYLILVVVMLRCLDTRENLKLFLWSHVAGCFYLGWIVYTEYDGGRFEGFGGPGINEANAGALQMLTGVFVAAGLFLAGRIRERLALVGLIPFVVNGLIAAVSRSGFLAAAAGGLAFNLAAPHRQRFRVGMLSILAVTLFFMLTNDTYWDRITSIKKLGEDVEGVDTGAGRLDLMKAQLQMFAEYPVGCGHRCTVTLSPGYLDDKDLTSSTIDGPRGRASHSTPMSLLVEQGFPGIAMYLALLLWCAVVGAKTLRACRRAGGEYPAFATSILACLTSIFVGDFFVDYLKFETRLWFVTVLVVVLGLARAEAKVTASSVPEPEPSVNRSGGRWPEARRKLGSRV